MREELIKTILEIAGDEMDNKEGLKELAFETVEELTNRVMNIAHVLYHELQTL